MKIWVGPEMEGSKKHIKTIFIKSTHVDGMKILEVLHHHLDSNVKRIYLGAGKVDVTSEQNLKLLSKYCIIHNIELVTECSIDGYKNLPQEIKDRTNLIIRFDVPELKYLSLLDSIKIDTGEAVFVKELEEFCVTTLINCDGEKFNCDKTIYEEE